MTFCDHGIVLRSRPLRENDRIVTIFTRDRGRLEVAFKSVRLAKGKLRALSEPISRGDYRLFLKNDRGLPVCTGGQTLSVFPRIRLSQDLLFTAIYFCEVINKITPLYQPSPEKHDLLLGALEHLDRPEYAAPRETPAPVGAAASLGTTGAIGTTGSLARDPGPRPAGAAINPWMRRAFTLRALDAAGFGFRHTSVGLDARLWDTLHAGAWTELRALESDPRGLDLLDDILKRFFAEQLDQRLMSLEFVR